MILESGNKVDVCWIVVINVKGVGLFVVGWLLFSVNVFIYILEVFIVLCDLKVNYFLYLVIWVNGMIFNFDLV